jgi:D-beta-D-heptose 7-phosphate kinase/D-beta-D-heptose 1-phosphate adenosyltransferase
MEFDLNQFSDCRIQVVGDLMIDEYVWGSVDRISPEAPVQVVTVTGEDYTLGGAGNVVNNLAALGARVAVGGVIGDDANGRLLIQMLGDLGADCRAVVTETGRPTTVKTRIIAAHQHVLRIDRETRQEIAQATISSLAETVESILEGIPVLVLSDYGKGLFTDAFLKRVISAARKHDCITIVDPKGSDYRRYNEASLVTPNRKEAALASGVEIHDDKSLQQAGMQLLQQTTIERILVTLGKDGMALFERGRTEPLRITAETRQVFDVSGAGDTVVATLGVALAAGADYRQAMALANTAAGIVVGKLGTATVSREELAQRLAPSVEETFRKVTSLPELRKIVRDLKRRNRRIVLTNGCFDLIHAGHIALFSAAKNLGDVLIVAIDDDASVRRIKGAGRPVIKAKERTRIIGALDVVDYVVVFSAGELEALIEIVKPDVLAKGSNYREETVRGHKLVETHGGRVALIPVNDNVSSTDIINQIKNG